MKNKFIRILIFILILIAIIIGIRFLLGGSEDDWICVNGQWIKHGNPSASMPAKLCK